MAGTGRGSAGPAAPWAGKGRVANFLGKLVNCVREHIFLLGFNIFSTTSEIFDCLNQHEYYLKPSLICTLDGPIPKNLRELVDIGVEVLKCTLKEDRTTTVPPAGDSTSAESELPENEPTTESGAVSDDVMT